MTAASSTSPHAVLIDYRRPDHQSTRPERTCLVRADRAGGRAERARRRGTHSLPATRSVAFVTGRFDYIVRLACRDAADLDQTVRELRSRGGVAATETRIVMRSTDPAR